MNANINRTFLSYTQTPKYVIFHSKYIYLKLQEYIVLKRSGSIIKKFCSLESYGLLIILLDYLNSK